MNVNSLSSLFFLFCVLLLWHNPSQAQRYRYKMDLNKVINDAIEVELEVPANILSEQMTYHFPKIIPGTYEIQDFGQFVNNLKALDKKGKELPVERVDKNTWIIRNGKKLDKITYLLDDTWDANLREPIFEPSGTSFEPGKVFVLNNNGCFGFFKGHEKMPFELTIDRPNSMFGTTSLRRLDEGSDFDTDVFLADSYQILVDSPIMYCEPDTVKYTLGYGEILISIYSPNREVKAKDIGAKILPMLEAQKKYLGDLLPVNQYCFIIYLSPNGYPSGSIGALEHSRSSFFCLLEEKADKIGKIVVDIAAHEFFHIVTPLYIQSEEIFNFDFMEPKMSKHLWLYEGVVEYMAQHMQVRYQLSKQDEFLNTLSDKIRVSFRYKDGISLTEMSANCLVPPYSKQYNNIYYKGAINAACFDALLLKISNGKYDLQLLLRDLSLLYGSSGETRPFKDKELFDDICQKILDRRPEIPKGQSKLVREFFKKHVEGIEKYDYNQFFNAFGIEYVEEAAVEEISPLGGIENGVLRTDSLNRFYIAKHDKLDEFGKNGIGFLEGDVFLEWNGKPFGPNSASGVLLTYVNNAKENDPLEIKILRKVGEVYEQKILTAKVSKIKVDKKHVLRFMDKASEEQLKLRKIWLEPRPAS